MLTKEEVKKLFTLSDNNLREYRKLGMPFEIHGKDYEYPKNKTIRWQVDRQTLVATKLVVGKNYLNQEISEILLCSDQGGMRRSHSTGTLTLFTDTVNSNNSYQDRWINGILHYTGMGQDGDQVLEGNANKVLAETFNTHAITAVHLFETVEEKIAGSKKKKTLHKYIGQVEMIDKEYIEIENGRNVYKFPLKVIKGEKVFTETDLKNVEKESQKKVTKLSYEEIKQRAIEASEANKESDDQSLTVDKNKKKKRMSSKRIVKTVVYDRDEYISALVKLESKGKCQLCEQDAPFIDEYGVPYLESHHIIWLSEGGKDTLDNCVALCPNCHRKMHSLALKSDVEKLKEKIKRYSFL